MTAFVPLIIFLILYLGSGAYFSFIGTDNPLHQVSPVICLLPALFFAVSRGTNKIQHNIDTVIKGMGDKNTLTMCLIFLFSGAFSAVTQSIGSADTVANLILNFLPARLLLPGVFLASAFISTAIGTSMGVVALMVPIAVNLAKSGAFGLEIGTATVVGGAVFGDNLSMISDTTIASVSSQGASAKDKLKINSKVAFTAGIITLTYLAVISSIRSEVWFKKQQLAGFEKGLVPFVSKSDTTKLSAQEIYSLALTVQNMNSYDRQHNAVSVAQHGYSLMEYSLGHPKMSTSLARIL